MGAWFGACQPTKIPSIYGCSGAGFIFHGERDLNWDPELVG